jgi:hypothetical protein
MGNNRWLGALRAICVCEVRGRETGAQRACGSMVRGRETRAQRGSAAKQNFAELRSQAELGNEK